MNLINKAIESVRKAQIYPAAGKPLLAEKINRNAPCSCGSGKKAKHCHGAKTKYYQLKDKEAK